MDLVCIAGAPVVPVFHGYCRVGRCGLISQEQFSCVLLTQHGYHICLIRLCSTQCEEADW